MDGARVRKGAAMVILQVASVAEAAEQAILMQVFGAELVLDLSAILGEERELRENSDQDKSH